MASDAQLYIGLMSGTSVDGIDVAVLDFSSTSPRLLHSSTHPYQPAMAARIHRLCQSQQVQLEQLGQLDVELGAVFATAVEQVLRDLSLCRDDIIAIGSHGQTVRHGPNAAQPFTFQIGDPNTLAVGTGIDVIADFRRKDMALGGQGAPLVPAFHQAVFGHRHTNRAIVNIGGIANITWLPASADINDVIGFDTGPGNRLLDAWCAHCIGQAYDVDGRWAATGTISPILLAKLLAHPFVQQAHPKSTGREAFNLEWLTQVVSDLPDLSFGPLSKPEPLSDADVQRTLVEFTAVTIACQLAPFEALQEVYVCGGGAYNPLLLDRLRAMLEPIDVATTDHIGLSADCVEASAFAWLAYAYCHNLSGNVPAVTGASRAAVLGSRYPAN